MIEQRPSRRRPLRERLELEPRALRRRADLRALPFETTEEVEPLVGTIGQPRALDAIEFGLEVETFGYNLFVSGQPGSGRESTVRDYLTRFSAGRPRADDWVYVHSFDEPDRPRAIRLPAGAGRELARDMDEFVQAAKREVPRAFESEQYERRQREIRTEVGRQREELVGALRAFAAERQFALEITPAGVVTAPLHDGRPLSTEEFARLAPEEQRRITKANEEIEAETAAFLRRLHLLEKETEEQMHRLEREVALFATGRLFHELREKYAQHPPVLAYLAQLQDDLPEHVDDFRGQAEGGLAALLEARRTNSLARYSVNVLVDNGGQEGSPVVVETNPTSYNLLGRVEYRPAFGSMVTDFREIKAGALHRANGGFLLLDALELLQRPFAWQALKRALRDRQVRIENLADEYSPVPTATLRPEPIPLDVKVVLIGVPALHGLLLALDQDFRELFRVKADFAPDMEWSAQHFRSYAAFVSRWVRESGLRHFDRAAVGRLIEHGARLREDRRKLSTRFLDISDVVSESSFWAGKAGHDVVRVEDVDRAIAKREYRSSLLEERIRELIADGTIVIDTDGWRAGQVNGVSVLDLGDHSFGIPSRVSARVSIGRGSVRSIEREIELSGPIHSKGFLILSGYLAGQYAQEQPLAVAATITFEQSYGEVEGDSASSTELYALLSALSGLPLDQSIAVTGSVDQHGQVQAVGGVTRKVEGFFATCRARGLTGRQGVIIPAANVPNLMLEDEVVDAVRTGLFHVWAVRTIDEGIELLTGRKAGRRRADGSFPAGSVHALVAARLAAYAERMRDFAEAPEDGRERRLPAGR
ncbi:MAG TPA: ATP-binding protein [Gaiellaceae bacterium]|nr:ATP-binding protein [Gaiellaceae bacterium]